ncbi:gliding motility-associated C-terminal domain-containing protein [bacterium]|nr:gliding motility-associated C-terminal domain-containing protein [bacterium]
MKSRYLILVLVILFISLVSPHLKAYENVPTDVAEYAEWKRSLAEERSRSHMVSPLDIDSDNGYVIARLDENSGSYDEAADASGGSSWQSLTYGWPSPPWDWQIYKIDGHTPQQTDGAGPPGPDCTLIGTPDACYTEWDAAEGTNIIWTVWNNEHGVKIMQKVQAVSLGTSPGDVEQIEFTVLFIPVDGACHSCGAVKYYDTMLALNDGAPISTAFGYTAMAEIFYAPSIPSIWRAYESGYPPSPGDLQALGVLIGYDAVMPDVFWCGQWPASNDNGWADSYWEADATGGFGGDTATMVKWYQQSVCPGDTLRFTTYYGIGDFGNFPIIQIVHNPPTILPTCDDVLPNPFTVEARISNIGNANATNVTATLSLGSAGLSIETGANPQNIGTITAYTGATNALWTVNIDPSIFGSTVCYDITVHYTNPDDSDSTIAGHYCIDIPDIYVMSVTATVDDPELCGGECTDLHASYSGGIPGGGNFFTNFDSDNGGFIGDGEWEWGNPDPYFDWLEFRNEGPDDAYSNPNCWCTDRNGAYTGTNINWSLISPTFYQPMGALGVLSFYHYMDCAPSTDGGNVKISTNSGTTWELLTPTGGYPATASFLNAAISGEGCYSGTTGGWVYAEFDISAYAGNIFQIKFHFGTSFSSLILSYPGWFIDNFELTGFSSGEVYQWWPSDGLSGTNIPDPTACPETTTTYNVEIDIGYGCIDTATVTVNVNPSPSVIVNDDSICAGESAILFAEVDPPSAGYTYYWTPGGYRTQEITVTPTTTTNYIVTVTSGSCGSAPDTATVYVSPDIIVDPGRETTIMYEDCVILGGSPTGQGGTPGLSYEWYPIDGIRDPYSPNPEACPSDTTDYCVIVTDAIGCAETSCVTINVLFDTLGPEAVIIEPLPNTYSACEDQRIIIVITDSSGVDHSTLELQVNREYYYDDSPEISWSGDTLIFTPPPGYWTDAEVVEVRLNRADDIFGNPLQGAPIVWTFIIDYSPPVAWGEFPPPDTIITIPSPMINVYVADSGSGLDYTGMGLIINGDFYPYDTTGMRFDPVNGLLRFDPSALGIRFEDGDTVEVCLTGAQDMPDYCDPNVMIDHCWESYVVISELYAEIVEPFNGAYSACDDQRIIIRIVSPYPIDTTTIELNVEGVLYTISHDWLSYDGDSLLVFQPDPGFWSNGQVVHVELTRADDIYGFPLADILTWSFVIDLAPPVIYNMIPAPEAAVPDSSPLISFDLADSLSGLDETTIVLTVNGTVFNTDSAGITWDGEHLELDCDLAELGFSDGDTVEVCVHAEDSPDYCDPNALDTCWHFYIVLAGPIATIIEPLDSTITACDDQCIYILIEDPDGVDESTIELIVNGESYNILSPELSMISDTLIFCLSTPWSDNEIVTVELVSADDVYGNDLQNPLTWLFMVDLSPPVYFDWNPLDGEIITDPYQEIIVSITDSLSGVDDTSIILTVDGIPYGLTDPGITYTVDSSGAYPVYNIVFSPLDAGIEFEHNDTIQVCIYSYDSPDYCAANESEYCWIFIVDILGPVADLLHPFNGAVSSCDDQGAIILIYDREVSHGVDPSSIVFEVEVGGTTLTDPPTRWVFPETLYFEPAPGTWSNNDSVVIRLLEASDSVGNGLDAFYTWFYLIDLESPTLMHPYPPIWGEVGDLSPVITFELIDNLAGVELDSTRICINGFCFGLANPSFNRTDSAYSFNCDLAGISFEGGDTVEICVRGIDMPDLCAPNRLDTCWYFTIPVGGPVGTIIEPDSNTYSACDDQRIIMLVQDPDGVVDSTIELEVNGRIYTTSDGELTYDGDSLIFTPSTLWSDGDVVNVCLLAAEDIFTNPLEDAPICWEFIIDLTPPEVTSVDPVPGSEVMTTCPVITFSLSDRLSGLNETSVELTVNSVTFTIFDPSVDWDGMNFTIDLCAAGFDISGGDVITVCLYAEDNPDYCGPNVLDTCWNFIVAGGGPIAEIISPLDSTYSACEPETIFISLYDSNGVDDTTIVLVVNGVEYRIGAPELDYAGDILSFTGGPGFWTDGEVVSVELIRADDVLGNPLETPLSWIFTLDYSPPVHSGESPFIGGYVEDFSPLIYFLLYDELSGLDVASIEVWIEGIPYSFLDSPLWWAAGTVFFDPDSIPLEFEPGDTIEVCVAADDMPDYCDPNHLHDCWEFNIAHGGPIATIIKPLPNTYSACEDQGIIITLIDSNGVNEATIELEVEGTLYHTSDMELTFSAGTLLTFIPSPWFDDAETVQVHLLAAEDSIGNELEGELEWTFVMDLSPPVAWGFTPASGSVVSNPSPTVSVSIDDILSGLDESSIILDIDGTTFDISSPCVTWTGEIFEVSTECAGLSWSGGTTVEVCLTAYDTPDYCAPNTLEVCWDFHIATGGPIAEIVIPADSSVSACEDQGIVIYLTDPDGVVPESIELQVRDVVYTVDDTYLTYIPDTLYFTPGAGYWVDGETVYVAVLAADDALGNPLSGAPVEGIFFMDLSGPVASNFVPVDAADVYNWQQSIQVDLTDNLLGVDSNSIELEITGIYRAPGPLTFDMASGLISWDGLTVTFDPSAVDEGDFGITYAPEEDSMNGTGLYFPEFTTIEIAVYATDNEPDYCAPNPIQEPNTWSFYVPDDDTIPPRFADFQPPYRPTRLPFDIFCDFVDSSGLYRNNAQTIYGSNLDATLDTIPMEPTSGSDTTVVNGETIINFTTVGEVPSYQDTCTLTFRIFGYDNDFDFMNPFDRALGMDTFFVSILEGPTATPVEPLPNTISSCDDQGIFIQLYDNDGIDTLTIILEVEQVAYTIDHQWLTYSAEENLLVLQPDIPVFSNEQAVEVALVNVHDNLGNPMWDTLSWTFFIDLEAPVCSLSSPMNHSMIGDPTPSIEIRIDDNLAGVRPETIEITVNSVPYEVADNGLYWYFDDNDRDGSLIIDCDQANISFVPGDTVSLSLEMGDDPDYCAPNMGSCDWWFTIEPKVWCYAGPNPFTPNGDAVNENVFFKYPNMHSKNAEIIILNLRNVEVWRKTVKSASSISDYLERSWNGQDSKGKPLPEGIYIYVIQVDGKVECNGTIILAR